MPSKLPPNLCIRCKGARRLCGRRYCPILLRFTYSYKTIIKLKSLDVEGATPPGVLVGEYGYPRIRVSPLLTLEKGIRAKIYDHPSEWWGKLNLRDIVSLKASTLYPSMKVGVEIGKSTKTSSLLSELQHALLSVNPVELEAKLKSYPKPTLRFDGVITPSGPSVPLENVRVVGNPRVDRSVERMVSDWDVRARNAMIELYSRGVSIYDIIRALSVGALGRSIERRLVPSRWAITATDYTLSEHLRKRMLEMRELGEILLYHISYLHNSFTLLLLPGPYNLEMVEVWYPRSAWARYSSNPQLNIIYEYSDGVRRGPMDGGYYAIRMGVLEGLVNVLKRQAMAIVVREVFPEYEVPLGNWHIRESVRRAFTTRPYRFSEASEAIDFMCNLLKFPVNMLVNNSNLLKKYLYQEKITKYLNSNS